MYQIEFDPRMLEIEFAVSVILKPLKKFNYIKKASQNHAKNPVFVKFCKFHTTTFKTAPKGKLRLRSGLGYAFLSRTLSPSETISQKEISTTSFPFSAFPFPLHPFWSNLKYSTFPHYLAPPIT